MRSPNLDTYPNNPKFSEEGNCDVPAPIPPNDVGTSYINSWLTLVATHRVANARWQVRANVEPGHRRS